MRFLTNSSEEYQRFDSHIEYLEEENGESLPMWTYASEELLELEYEEIFLKSWQFAGHVCELEEPGSYIVFDLWRDSVIIMKGHDGVIRAFQNVCRHRASRLLDGKGQCKNLIKCQYHGWTFGWDGSLKGITFPDKYPEHDPETLGLNQVEVEFYRGIIFVKMAKSDCLSVKEQYAPIDEFIAAYHTDDLVAIDGDFSQEWNCNWKLAWDNYCENYHIPVGHPGLQRFTQESGEGGELSTGIGFGIFRMKDKLSKVTDEARYQELLPTSAHRVDDPIKNCWLQVGMQMNMGIEFSNEVFWAFQILPKGVEKTEVRYRCFTRKDLSDEERELVELNCKLNGKVNDEDKFLVERIQRGAKTHAYKPGPLSYIESTLYLFHKRFRKKFPISEKETPPAWGRLKEENAKLKGEKT